MMQMKAAILTKANTPFRVESVSLDPPKADEVLIKIAASGVCRSDWRVAIGTAPKPMPIITGHEGAGVVEAVGPGVTRVGVGDHVALSWAPGCGDCFYCHHDKPNLCESYRQLLASGLQADGKSRIRWNDQAVYILAGLGTFAEYAGGAAGELPADTARCAFGSGCLGWLRRGNRRRRGDVQRGRAPRAERRGFRRGRYRP